MELRADAVIAGKLRLLRPLGQGGMGIVWAARHLDLDAEVAVKLIRPERIASDSGAAERFAREAKLAARIRHPHVVGVSDYGVVDGVPYLVMELLQGASLAELLERGGRLSFGTARSLVRQMGGALECAHELGIVHRDIKPHNVFMTEGARDYPLFVKVLDFGVAKTIDAAPGAGTLTETGVAIGSPPYMSPEQLEASADIDRRADLWSLAVIVYECLTGELPFKGSSAYTVGAAVLAGRYRPVTELRPDLPQSIDQWFAKALCVDPDARFQSARELVEAFDDQPVPSDARPEAEHQPLPLELAETAQAGALAPAAPPAATVDHAPVAVPPRAPAAGSSRRIRVAAAVLTVVLAAGFAIARALPARSARCPADMVRIEGATFTMGSDEGVDTYTNELPAHDVTVGSFCLDRTEVAVRDCPACQRLRTVEAEQLTTNARRVFGQFCSGADRPDHPANCIDWHDATAHCAKLGKRLPSEAEWELAARGRVRRKYPWGEAAVSPQRVNACGPECVKLMSERAGLQWPQVYDVDDHAPATAPVGSYPEGATPEGVLDLAGNVWEWTQSASCPYDKPDCGDSRRVIRGGGWDAREATDLRAARREAAAPGTRGWNVGFRCARDP